MRASPSYSPRYSPPQAQNSRQYYHQIPRHNYQKNYNNNHHKRRQSYSNYNRRTPPHHYGNDTKFPTPTKTFNKPVSHNRKPRSTYSHSNHSQYSQDNDDSYYEDDEYHYRDNKYYDNHYENDDHYNDDYNERYSSQSNNEPPQKKQKYMHQNQRIQHNQKSKEQDHQYTKSEKSRWKPIGQTESNIEKDFKFENETLRPENSNIDQSINTEEPNQDFFDEAPKSYEGISIEAQDSKHLPNKSRAFNNDIPTKAEEPDKDMLSQFQVTNEDLLHQTNKTNEPIKIESNNKDVTSQAEDTNRYVPSQVREVMDTEELENHAIQYQTHKSKDTEIIEAFKENEIVTEFYDRLSQVGEGTYGKVYKARNNVSKSLVALKRIRMEQERDGFPVTALREIKLLQQSHHENIVRLHEMLVSKGSVYMVFEYMDHDLTGLLQHGPHLFEINHKKSLCQQMLKGLCFLHQRGILHRDMKGSNILISNKGVLKLADFGLARFYHKHRLADYTNRVITIWYRPPELLLGATNYGPEVDMWSAGCIMLEIFTTKPVFQGDNEVHQLEIIYKILGAPSEADWPGLNQLPWFELVRPQGKPNANKFRDTFKK